MSDPVHKVRTIEKYNQAEDARWYAGEVKPAKLHSGALSRSDFVATDTSEGVCFALSIWWIIQRADEKDFWKWLVGAGPQVAAVQELSRKQLQKPKGPARESWRFEVGHDAIIKNSKLKRSSEYLMNKGTEFNKAGYYYISIHGNIPESGEHFGHGIAMYLNPDGACRYFDPNVGEFETDSPEELIAALNKLVRTYPVTGREIRFCCYT